MKFRKKPAVIDAIQYHGHDRSRNELHEWLRDFGAAFPLDSDADGAIVIPTLEGQHIASPGDWIIRGVKGEYYPCKPDIFAATYEPANA